MRVHLYTYSRTPARACQVAAAAFPASHARQVVAAATTSLGNQVAGAGTPSSCNG